MIFVFITVYLNWCCWRKTHFFLNCRIWTGPASNLLIWLLTRIQEQRSLWVTSARSSWLDSTASQSPILMVLSSSVITFPALFTPPGLNLCSALCGTWQRWIEWQLCHWRKIFSIPNWLSFHIVLQKMLSLWALLSLYASILIIESTVFCVFYVKLFEEDLILSVSMNNSIRIYVSVCPVIEPEKTLWIFM